VFSDIDLLRCSDLLTATLDLGLLLYLIRVYKLLLLSFTALMLYVIFELQI
jgi:hypothetical protein